MKSAGTFKNAPIAAADATAVASLLASLQTLPVGNGLTNPISGVPLTAPRTLSPEQQAFLSFIQSPFVQDTLFAIAQPSAVHLSNSSSVGNRWALGSFDPRDRAVTMHFGSRTGRGRETTFMHEIGHLVSETSNRTSLQGLQQRLWGRMNQAHAERSMSEKEEAFAETFMRSLELVRSLQSTPMNSSGVSARIGHLDSMYPGAREVADWLVTEGPFKQHPYSAAVRR